MSGQHRIVVLGAGYAGLAAARRLARKAGDARVTVIDARAEFTERVRLHQCAAGQNVARWDIGDTLARKGIGFVRARATGIDPAARRVLLDGAEPVEYDTLVYALGSVRDAAGVPGAAEYALSVATPEDVAALRKALTEVEALKEGAAREKIAAPGRAPAPKGTARSRTRVVVVGGGATGVELATEIAESQPDSAVSLLSSEEPAGWLSPRATAHVRATLERLGVEIRSGAKVVEVLPHGVRLADGTVVEADTTVWTTGFGVPPLAAASGLAVDGRGRVRTDATLRSVSHPEVYAVGDSAVVAGPGGRELRMACATALPTGKYAADALLARVRGREPRDFRFRYVLQCVSLGRRDAVVQFVRADDSPARTVLTGKLGAWVKEQIVRGAERSTHP